MTSSVKESPAYYEALNKCKFYGLSVATLLSASGNYWEPEQRDEISDDLKYQSQRALECIDSDLM